jgi:hypothetical protein
MMTPTITLSRALVDPELFGGTFAQPSMWTWRVIGKLIDGIALTEPREIDLYRECTGRSALPTGPVRSIVLLVGRRGGKDRFWSAVAVHRAALAADWSKYQSAGEGAVCILLGADRKQASILRRYCRGLLQTPLLKAEVTRDTDDLIEFRNGASLEIATNNAALVRGRSAIAVLGSECCYWKTDEHSSSSDEEVVGAASPSMAMCPDGGLLLLGSSVYRQRGYMHRRWKELHGNDADEDICWFAPSPVMNPKLPQRVIEKALAGDKRKGEAEFLNVWRDDLSEFIPADVVDSVTDRGTYERAPLPGLQYFAFADAAGGTGTDSFALAIASRGAPCRLEAVRERRPRFVPAQVISEFADLLRAYGVTKVEGDAYAGGFHSSEWTQHGIEFIPCERSTSENYLAALPLLLAGRVRLLDSSTLRNQLSSLERRVGGDRERVDHPAHASAHDDVSCAACGALVAAAQPGAGDYLNSGWLDDSAAPPAPRRLWPGMSAEREAQILRTPPLIAREFTRDLP